MRNIDWSRMPWPFNGFMPEKTHEPVLPGKTFFLREAEHHIHEPVGEVCLICGRTIHRKWFIKEMGIEYVGEIDERGPGSLRYVGAEKI